MIESLRSRVDSVLGDGVEAVVKAKHRRRLTKLGWERMFNPTEPGIWAAGDPAPREGCSMEVLIDGANALPVMARELSRAKKFVHLTDWHLAPAFDLVRGDSPEVIGRLLAELAERVDVRVLVWSGAPIPAFHPTRKEVSEAVRNLTRGTRIRCEADPREHPLHCHHEKTIVIDGEVAFVGGIDLTDDGGDRFDSSAHEGEAQARLARRRGQARRPGGRRRGRPLRPALEGADRRAAVAA
jgi:phosphatidylserine/phosphatidylglycerophosphate/cardiolipin synthase-like enzyme